MQLFRVLYRRRLNKEVDQQSQKDTRKQVKKVSNKKLLSFADDEDDEEGLSRGIVSFQEASGILPKDEANVVKEEKPKGNAWVEKMKAMIQEKEDRKESMTEAKDDVNAKESEQEQKQKQTPSNSVKLTPEEEMKARVKEKIREMKKKSKEVCHVIARLL